jgi:hypothetical protein
MNTRFQEFLQGAGRGAAGGLLAAGVMSRFQTVWSKAQEPSNGETQSEDESATVKAAEMLSHAVLRHPMSAQEKKIAGPLMHYAFGAVIGAAYGVLQSEVPMISRGAGTLYGTLVWAVADEVVVPALGLARPPQDYPPNVHARALAAHLVYGVALYGFDRVLRKLRSPEGKVSEGLRIQAA